MKQKADITMKVTSEEEDLINAIRNYCDSYPDGYPELLEYAQDIIRQNDGHAKVEIKSSPFGEGTSK